MVLAKRDGEILMQLLVEPGDEGIPMITLHDPADRPQRDENGKPTWQPFSLLHLTVTDDSKPKIYSSEEGDDLIEHLPV